MLGTIVEYEQEPQKFVKFCEEVSVRLIQRKSHEEVEALFWQPEDYKRMRADSRSEAQIESAQPYRRTRSRVREVQRRVAERTRSRRITVIGDDGPMCSRCVYAHADSMCITKDQFKSQHILPVSRRCREHNDSCLACTPNMHALCA